MTIDEQLKERVRQIAAWDYDTLNDDHIAGGFERLAADICTALDGYAAEVAALKARNDERDRALMLFGAICILNDSPEATAEAHAELAIQRRNNIKNPARVFPAFYAAWEAHLAKQAGEATPT